jgi:glycosyltransferase involved in cell wall biosynthesis
MYTCDITIIIPTYKPDTYIFECLDSFKCQTFPVEYFEIIIILNGPRDPYYETITQYIKKNLLYNDVKLLHTGIAGVSNARNMGLDQARGQYIAFVDDDDIISKEYLKLMFDIAKNDIVPLSYLKAFKGGLFDNFGDYITNVYEKNINKKINILNTRSYFSIPVCKLIKRNIIGDKRFDVHFQNGEDSLFMFSISGKIKQMQFTNKKAVYYRRIRENSLQNMRRSAKDRIDNMVCLIFEYTRLYMKKPSDYNFLFYFSRILACFKGLRIFC